MLTLKKMESQTPGKIFNNSKITKIISLRKGRTKIGARYVVAKTSTPDLYYGKAPVYDTSILVLKRKPCAVKVPLKNLRISQAYVKVACSCPYFTFWGCEVPLYKSDAADIFYSNGKDPNIRNPAQRRWVCKHLLVLFKKCAFEGL